MTFYGFSDPGTQALMLVDEVRTAAFAAAIAAVVRRDDVVLDIGSGSGILSLLAAKAGARRVVAVERSAMAEVVRGNVRANAMDGQIEVVEGRLEDLDLAAFGEPATVVISETLGHFAPDEDTNRLYRAAAKLATPTARMIPSGYRVAFAVAEVERLSRELALLDDYHGVRLPSLTARLRSRPTVSRVTTGELLGSSVNGPTVAMVDRTPDRFEAELTIGRAGEANAIVASFEADLAPGLTLATHPASLPTHWQQLIFPLDPPLSCAVGDSVEVAVRPLLVTDRGTYRWSAARGEEVRAGDAMRSLVVSSVEDLATQLGLKLQRSPRYHVNDRLRAFAALLDGPLDGGDADTLARRLMDSMPAVFRDIADARGEALVLLEAASAL